MTATENGVSVLAQLQMSERLRYLEQGAFPFEPGTATALLAGTSYADKLAAAKNEEELTEVLNNVFDCGDLHIDLVTHWGDQMIHPFYIRRFLFPTHLLRWSIPSIWMDFMRECSERDVPALTDIFLGFCTNNSSYEIGDLELESNSVLLPEYALEMSMACSSLDVLSGQFGPGEVSGQFLRTLHAFGQKLAKDLWFFFSGRTGSKFDVRLHTFNKLAEELYSIQIKEDVDGNYSLSFTQ